MPKQPLSFAKDIITEQPNKVEKVTPSMPVLDLGLDMPSLLEPEPSERQPKKERTKRMSTCKF